jgi:hypothetical protein
MRIFLILAPYAAFALLMAVTSTASSLFAAAAICLAIIAFDILRGRSIKLMGAGSALIFAGLGCYQIFGGEPLGNMAVKIAVDCGLFAIGLFSLAIRRPFTLQYAREMTDPEIARLPGFVTANTIITWVWVVAFLLMVSANLLLLNWPNLPLWSGLVIAFAIRNPAIYFSKWYPGYHRRKFGAITQAH